MTRQFRPGPNKVILDLPGGVVDKPNTPQEAISKELLEETGYQGKVELAGALLLDGYATQTQYCFVIKECIKQSEQQLEEDEYIEIELLSLDTFYKYLRGGQLSDVGGGYMALDYLGYL